MVDETANIAAICCPLGLDILKIDKNSTDLYFIFQFGGLGALFGGITVPKPPSRRDCVQSRSMMRARLGLFMKFVIEMDKSK